MLQVLRGALPYTGAYYVLRLVSERVIRYLLGPEKASQEARVLRASLFVLSTVNAIIGTLFSKDQEPKLKRFEKWERETGEDKDINREQVAFGMENVLQNSQRLTLSLLGYLLHDLITILPQWRRYKADVAHHVVGWVIGLCILLQPREMLRFVPGITMLEASTIPLNLMWITNEYPAVRDLPLVGRTLLNPRLLQPVFIASFTYLRMIWYPLFFNRIRVDKPRVWAEVLGVSRQAFVVLQYGIHVFWFKLLVKKVMRLMKK